MRLELILMIVLTRFSKFYYTLRNVFLTIPIYLKDLVQFSVNLLFHLLQKKLNNVPMFVKN